MATQGNWLGRWIGQWFGGAGDPPDQGWISGAAVLSVSASGSLTDGANDGFQRFISDDRAATAEEDELFQIAMALITSGVLECH